MNFKQLQKEDLKSCYNADEFAVTAQYYPYGSELYLLTGIFDEPDKVAEAGGVDVVTTEPCFSVIESDLQTDPSNRDEIEINGKRYRVRDYEPDGVGTVDIYLSYIMN